MLKPYLILGYLLLFVGCQDTPEQTISIANPATSWQLTGFQKVDSLNPILQPDESTFFSCPLRDEEVHWEARNVLNPSAVVKDGKVYLFYRAQDKSGTSRIGLATSDDGIHFARQAKPVLFPDNDHMKLHEWHVRKDPLTTKGENYFDGIEDPRVVERDDGTYFMTYTSYDGLTARLCMASSADLITWTKHGLVFTHEKHENDWSKSGAVVARLEGEKMIATKIAGKYWMYYGDTDIFIATSDDLEVWTPALNEENGSEIRVLHPRAGFFDSRLVEPGPAALLREEGILLIYNGSNAANFNDPTLPQFTYAAGQALFDKHAPYRMIDRAESYFIHPDKAYEKTGEVNEVCFVEGLVFFKGQWFLYYGTGDSKIAVAVKSL